MRDRLTPKEMRIVALIVQGCKNREIALRLKTTEQVIKNYLRSIYDKTGVSDRLGTGVVYDPPSRAGAGRRGSGQQAGCRGTGCSARRGLRAVAGIPPPRFCSLRKSDPEASRPSGNLVEKCHLAGCAKSLRQGDDDLAYLLVRFQVAIGILGLAEGEGLVDLRHEALVGERSETYFLATWALSGSRVISSTI